VRAGAPAGLQALPAGPLAEAADPPVSCRRPRHPAGQPLGRVRRRREDDLLRRGTRGMNALTAGRAITGTGAFV